MVRRKKRRRSTVRQSVEGTRVRLWRASELIRLVLILGAVAAGVLAMIFFGFPLIEDLVKQVDPSLRYRPQAEVDFVRGEQQQQIETPDTTEIYLTDYRVKNDPFIDGTKIIFTTQDPDKKTNIYQLDGVALYDTETGAVEMLPIEKKYDHLMSPVMSNGIVVLIDSRTDGGGRIIGYDTNTGEQFLVKEYAYAIPRLSISGNTLAFMQWSADTSQRLYAYDVVTREATTIKLIDSRAGSSSADISGSDLVWSEYDSAGDGVLKRMSFESGGAQYDNYDFGNTVFEPRTNGTDIVFSTSRNPEEGALMLSIQGGQPVKIADGVTNYDVGDGFVMYTKDGKIHLSYTSVQETMVLTAENAQQILACVNGKGFCYYDITDLNLLDEVVIYGYAS